MMKSTSNIDMMKQLRASSNNIILKADHSIHDGGSFVGDNDASRNYGKTTSQYHQRNSHLNSMIASAFDNDFGEVEAESEMNSDDIGFGFNNKRRQSEAGEEEDGDPTIRFMNDNEINDDLFKNYDQIDANDSVRME